MDVTVVVTSCNRYDLLEHTLASFREFNTYSGVGRVLVVEDGDGDPQDICHRFDADLMKTGNRIGQIRAIDAAYSEVKTPYIFHLEDDWEFYRPGFIEKSKTILDLDPSTLLVWLRAWHDTNGHPLSFKSKDRSFGVLTTGYQDVWHGFTFNPALRRLEDYHLMGSYSSHKAASDIWHGSAAHEVAAGRFYRDLGYRCVILEEGGYVRHTGWGRHVEYSL